MIKTENFLFYKKVLTKGENMKKIFLLVLLSVLFAHSQTVFENADCNIVGNPQNSCSITFSRFSFGQNFGTSGTNMFFFDVADLLISKDALPSSASVPLDPNAPVLPIRFFILSSDVGYNAAMSLIHTAYASRASVKVIFMNPAAKLLKNESSYKANTKSQQCYVNRVDGNPYSIHCPIMSITLSEN